MRIFRIAAAILCLASIFAAFHNPTARAQSGAITITVDALANRHSISPQIYGVAFASATALSDLNAPLNRSGGNGTSCYNWQLNASNHANDWYFESIGEDSSTAGESGDTFISTTKSASSQAMLTIPTIGWVAKVGPNRSKLASFSIAKYGPQTGNDWQWYADAGNGVKTGGQNVTGNDPTDANTPSTSTIEQGWVNHIVGKWGSAASGGLKYYILDNEPSIWHSTHRDVHPSGAAMEEIRDKTIDYATKIKQVDPGALVAGPEEWGWSGYLYSGYDQQYGSLHGWSNLPDRAAHGNKDYLPWFLDQLHQNDVANGKRLLDIFTVHYYPQGGEYGDDTSTAMQLRRNRSTRSLWDPAYVDETWINDKVQLIPRLKGWVNTWYPGTKTGVTEYNWGAEGHINGATTQADVYGIFGRENLDVATRWTTPDASTPTYKAMKLYRNYDGNKSTFGDTSVLATVPNPDNLSAFAATRSNDGALTIMIVNKSLSASTPVTVNIANFRSTAAQVWQLTSANQIARQTDLAIANNTIQLTVPTQSITLLVSSPSAAPSPTPTPTPSPTATPTPTPTATPTPSPTPTPTPSPTATPTPTPSPTPTPTPAPLILTEANSDRAIAIEGALHTRDPFPLIEPIQLGSDDRTRVMLFVENVTLLPGETVAAVSVIAQDSNQSQFALPVEYVGPVPGFEWMNSVIVRLYDTIPNANDLLLTIKLRGQSSNQARISVVPGTVPDLGPNASLHGRRVLPADNAWNQDISAMPVDPNSANLIASIGLGTGLHPDFGTTWNGAPNGIQYIVVSGAQTKVPILFDQFGDQSDAGPYPVPPDAPIEGGPGSSGDRHVIVIDRDNWKLYEMWAATPVNSGQSWTAGSGAVFDLFSNALRPAGWTSADAAGLPVFPGLVRYDEVFEQQQITHAIRFTANSTRKGYVSPARHFASNNTSTNLPPMGMRVRLKASVDISHLSPSMQVIARAMKTYGMILADNGSNWYVSGAPDPRWSDDDLATLHNLKGSDFEVVQMGTVVTK